MSRSKTEEREAFLERRRSGIGSSDIAAVMNKDPYSTPYDVWRDKRGLAPPIPDNAPMRRGREMEPLTALMYEERTDRKVRRVGLKRHPEHDWAIAHIDRQILMDPRGPGALELKAPGRDVFRIWQAKGIPDRVILQNQWQIFVAGWLWGSMFPFSADLWEGFVVDSESMSEIQAAMRDAGDRFWHDHVLADIPPAIDKTYELPPIPKDARLHVVESAEWEEVFDRLLEVKELMANLETTKEHWTGIAQELMDLDGLSAVERHDGTTRIYWTERAGSLRLDGKALEAALPLDRIAMASQLERLGVAHDDIPGILNEAGLDFDDYKYRTKGSRPFRLFSLTPKEV